MTDAEKAAKADLEKAQTSDLWLDAVDWLRREVLAGQEERIRELYAADPDTWWAPFHLSGGMAIRNLLRDAGLGEDTFGIENLDNVYIEMVEQAARCGEDLQ